MNFKKTLMITSVMLLTIGTVFFSGAIIGFASPTNQKATVTITFWWTEGTVEGQLYTQLINEFEAANPNIKVTSTQVGYFDQPNQWQNAYAAGNEPDVMRADVTWITTWAYNGFIQPISSDQITNISDFTPESLEKVAWQSQLYGIPQVVDALGVFYNKHIFSTAGITAPTNGFSFPNFAAAGQTIKTWAASQSTVVGNWTPSQFYPFNLQGFSYAFLPIMYGFNASYFSGNVLSQATMNFNTTQWVNALTYLRSILPGGNQSMTPPVANQGWGTIDSYFMGGRVAMQFQGPWAVAGYLSDGAMFNKSVYSQAFNVPLANVPSWVGPDNLGFMKVPYDINQGMYSGGHAYVISSHSTHSAEALKLANFLASPEADYLRAKINHLVSPRMSTYTSDYNTSDSYIPASDPITQGFRLNLNTGITRPIHPYWIPVDNIVAPVLEDFRANGTAIQTTINTIVTRVNAFFNTYHTISGGAGSINTLPRASPGFEAFSVLAGLFGSFILITLYQRKNRKLKP